MSTAAPTLREMILSSNDRKYEDVEIPEWGGITVRVRSLSDAQLGEYQAKSVALKSKSDSGGKGNDFEMEMRNRRSELLVQCLFDPDTDQRIFNSKDSKALGEKNAGVVAALFVLVQALSNLDKTFDKKVKDAEENFENSQPS